MARKPSRQLTHDENRRRTMEHVEFHQAEFMDTPRPAIIKRDPIKGKNESQCKYINAIKNKEARLIFGTGPAGVGKTYVAGCLAAEALLSGDYERIIITRPAVDAGESLGFLPGEVEEKYAPYLVPFREVLNERLGKTQVEYMLRSGKIEAMPLAYMRGVTFKNAFVVLDEAQNVTPVQMKMFLTRIGESSKVVINGDSSQKDIPGISGLDDALSKIYYIPSVRVVKFGREDIVRSGLVQEIIQAYEVE